MVKEMKKELDYFNVDGKYGWDQNDFKDLWMNKGGCACVTACDSFIYMRKYMGKDKLYPYDIDRITSLDYIDFSNSVKPYLRPRITGIDRLEIYVDGVSEFLEDMDEHSITLSEFSGDNPLDDKFLVKVVSYGSYRWFDLKELWNTGYRRKGGLILFNKNA